MAEPQEPIEEAPRPFVISVERTWKLYVLPVVALLYFIAIITLVVMGVSDVYAIPLEMFVWAGVILFAVVLLIQLPFLFKRRARKEVEAPVDVVEEPAYAPESSPAFELPMAESEVRDDEYFLTDETHKGLRVMEYSQPAKSMYRGAVYSKTMVPVTKEHTLRIENLAAEPHEL